MKKTLLIIVLKIVEISAFIVVPYLAGWWGRFCRVWDGAYLDHFAQWFLGAGTTIACFGLLVLLLDFIHEWIKANAEWAEKILTKLERKQ